MINHLRLLCSELAALPRELRAHRPRADSSGLVVEVGGGQSPHPAADVVVDKYVADDFERPAGAEMSFAKPVIVADGEALPLADKGASYVIASHVLEHAQRPDLFAAELSRVGRAGFVQVPSRRSEVTFGWRFHPWLIDLADDGVLEFHPREDAVAPAGAEFHTDYERSTLMKLWWLAHRSDWHHSVEWRDRLDVRVEGESSAPQTADYDFEATEHVLRKASAPPLPPPVADRVTCPTCSGSVKLGSDEAGCELCGGIYPVIGNVPLLLARD